MAFAPFTRESRFQPLDAQGTLPFVYHPQYNLSCGGIEKLHPFDTKKYGKIAQQLQTNLNLHPDQFARPLGNGKRLWNLGEVTPEDLRRVHTQEYLDSLKSSAMLAFITEVPPLGIIPNRILQRVLLRPVFLATEGTLVGADLALRHGWAINLSGGYHHAKSNTPVGGGFCFVDDISIAAHKILQKNPHFRILIVDLDAHQGNGHEEIAKNEPRIAIYDMYNGDTWPGDYIHREAITFDYPLRARTTDYWYLSALESTLPHAIDEIRPDLIIYNAGTDIYELDPIGALSVSREGIIQRDEIVFANAFARNIPILMVLSGGYHINSARIIGDSIENLWHKFLKNTLA